ncbi:polymorphic toxin-type HINT domain-containing protein [Micromonospora sp. NPDC049282]|uniref:polymorphic toxin-type HINT domain-containing protein n=1 Tax=Micromonospora sp. NPDC049282 TaxID=3364269 RepID=UPI003719AF46
MRRTHGWVGGCGTTPTAENQITADTRFSFDSQAYGAAPTSGLATAVETITGFSGGTRTYKKVSSATYDAYGRVDASFDIAGEKTDTDYVPASGGPVTQVITTNPLSWKSTVDLDPAFGVPVKITDPNNRVTEITYDAVGRTTAVWLPNRDRAIYGSAPSNSYTYTLSRSQPSFVTTKALNAGGGTDTSYLLLDGLGRPRQAQESAYGSGRILADTFYDAAGRIYKENAAYFDSGAIDTTIIKFRDDKDVPSQTKTLYDTAGRPIHSLLLGTNAGVQVEKARTSTTYHGDHTTVTPPTGDAATTVWTDLYGRTEKLWQYHGPTATGTYDETSYTYHPVGQLATVKDPAGNTWSYSYDIQGWPTSTTDPDTGTSTSKYNDLGELERTTDARPDTHDPETGATSAEPVDAVHINEDEALTDLSVRDGDGEFVTLHTTQHHPFWSESRDRWVDAADLRPTEELLSPDGVALMVAKVDNFSGQRTMRDLTVRSIHTYYVVAGNTPVLVHNCGGLDWSKAKIQTNGVDAVEQHLLRFTDGGPLESAEQGMLSRLRSISAGEMEATPHDLRFYTHELRESVLYRRAGFRTGQPEVGSYELWDELHTQSLND